MVFAVGEKPQVQALERTAPVVPMGARTTLGTLATGTGTGTGTSGNCPRSTARSTPVTVKAPGCVVGGLAGFQGGCWGGNAGVERLVLGWRDVSEFAVEAALV